MPFSFEFFLVLKITIILGVLLSLGALVDAKLLPAQLRSIRPTVQLGQLRPLTTFLAVFLAFVAVSYFLLYWHTYCTWFGHIPSRSFAFYSHLIPAYHYYDLHVYDKRMPFLRTPQFWDPANAGMPWQYPPAMSMLYAATAYGGEQEFRFLLALCIFVLLPALALARRLVADAVQAWYAYGFVIAAIIFSYPIWFEAIEGNVELYIAALVGAALLAYWRRCTYLAAVLIGVAAALKIFPFVYFGLMLCRRQFRQIAVGVGAVVASTFAGLWLMGPGLLHSWHEVKAGLAFNRGYMILPYSYITSVDHSGFGFVKQLLFKLHHGTLVSPGLLTAYMVATAVGGIGLYFLRIVKLPLVNQVAIFCVVSIVLPPTSLDYTLLHLYILWAILVVLAVQNAKLGIRMPGVTAGLVCLAVLFAPQSDVVYHEVSYNGQVKCLLLLLLGAIALRYPWTFSSESVPTVEKSSLRIAGDGPSPEMVQAFPQGKTIGA